MDESDDYGLIIWPRTVDDAMQVLDELESPCLCRGMEQSTWKVRCTLARHWEGLGPGKHDIVLHERRLMATFWSEATDLVPSREFSRVQHDPLRQVAMAQHFGLPTRLVDWSWSPHRAALFAVLQRQIGLGVVWWIDSDAVTKAIDTRCESLGKHRDPVTGEWDYSDAFTLDAPRYLLAIRDAIGFPRLAAQQGVFTFASDYFADHIATLAGLLVNAALAPSDHMGRLVIPHEWKGDIRDALESRGIDSFSLDLAHLDTAVQRALNHVVGRIRSP